MDGDPNGTGASDGSDGRKSADGRSALRSSRGKLRRSVSQSAIPRTSSAVALWGDAADEMSQDEERNDRTLQRILAENKKRRAKRENLVELQGNEWRIEGFGKGANIYHDQGKMSQGVTVIRCVGTTINLPLKVAHLMLNDLTDCRVRVKGCVASIEMVHCTSVELVLQGPVPVVQIDLCRGVLITFASKDENTRPKVVNASNTDVAAVDKATGVRDVLPTSMFGEQVVTYWKKHTGGNWTCESKTTEELKHGGYVAIAGIAGSTSNLMGMEASPPPPSKQTKAKE